MAHLPLEGLVVLDFSTLLPGPLATLMLAEAGAEVIKVEKPQGDDMRHFPPRLGETSAPFAVLNAGKRSIALDLKDPDQRAALRPLIERADILVEQFRPGVMAKLGLGYDAVRAINPRIIYCSITGFGQAGPRAQEAGHDLNYAAVSGLLSLSPGTAASPTVPPMLAADIGGGSLPAVLNILLALRRRDATGGHAPRHRHERCDVHLRLVRPRPGSCHRPFSGRGGEFPCRRIAALWSLRHARRAFPRSGGAGGEVLGDVLQRA